MRDDINILTFSGYYIPGYKGGGPIKTIKNLFDSAGQDVNFKLITRDRDLGSSTAYKEIISGDWNNVGNAKVFYTQLGFLGMYEIFSILLKKEYDIVYLNSFFSIKFSFIPILIIRIFKLKSAVIIGPRGEFSEGAFDMKPLRKRIYIKFYEFFNLHRDVIFQASSKYELEDIRSVLGKVDMFVAEDIGSQSYSPNLVTRTDGPLKIVFVSRISPMKNLLVALKILQFVKEPVVYHIYGPVEDHKYWEKCSSLLKILPDHIDVKYIGELDPANVINTISKYDLFFLPTKGENYGHVIAEALCAGIPLLIANTTPWRDLEKQGLGWDLPLCNLHAFSRVIDELAIMPYEQYLIMREHILNWSKEKFSQRDAVDANLEMFRYAYTKGQLNESKP